MHVRFAQLAVLLTSWGVCGAALAQLSVLGVEYRPDRSFPEHECFWHESQFPNPCSASAPLGGTLHVLLRNSGPSAVAINDVVLAGFSLSDVLVVQEQVVKRHPASIYFASLTSTQLQALLAAGEPVWWKADPATVAPGAVSQVVVRLRQGPQLASVDLQIVHSGGSVPASVPIVTDNPRIASIGFSEDLGRVYLYWRRAGGAAPTSILLDGNNITANTVTVSDPSLTMAASVVQLSQPFVAGSMHVFQGVYADGRTATSGVRPWPNNFIHGTWGAKAAGDDDFDGARAWIDDATRHSVNALVVQLGSSGLGDYLKTEPGRQYAADRGYRFVIDEIQKWGVLTPQMLFIRDEPDAADSRVVNLAENKKVGSLGMMSIDQGEALRVAYPTVPTTLNIDGTYKPYNWYNYGQVPDVLMTDPYYQARLREAYWNNPNRIPLYQKATYIYAVSQLAQSSCEPNPLHVILYSCEYRDTASGRVFPFPTPESKRFEVYYALAGGAKGISYWWYLQGNPSNGLGAGTAGAQALWREIGLLGAELRIAAPLLVTSCPGTVPVQSTPGVWVRPLLVGNDTMILLVVNDQYYNDEAGCHYTPVQNASLTVNLPSWLQSPTAFEVLAGGTRDVTAQLSPDQLQLNLGTVDLTRMIVLSGNAQLKTTLQQRFEQPVRSGVCSFAPEVCLTTPPGITQHPQPQTVCSGGTAVFAVTAGGPAPLTYQWQKDQADLSNGGHYTGVNTPTLTISSLAEADEASYRCVVTNSFGSATSNEASLSVASCGAGCLQNFGFEDGFTTGVANSWTKFNRLGNVTCAEEATEHHGGLRSQEFYSHDVDNDGGVYQQFATALGQPYLISAWFKVFSPQGSGIAEGWLGVDPAGGINPSAASVLWSSKPYTEWSQKTFAITATGNLVTVFLRGRSTKAASLNRVGYVWVDDVEVVPGAPTDGIAQALTAGSIRWKWVDLPAETGYRVVDGTGTNVSGVLATNQAEWDETGLVANAQYTRHIRTLTACGESASSSGQIRWTLASIPVTGSVTPQIASGCANRDVTWTAHAGFGAGGVQYYRYAWDQNPTHTWTDTEAQWSSGTLTTVPLSVGRWYLHVRAFNGENAAGGSFDYEFSANSHVPPDLDDDCDVDLDDFRLFETCVSGATVAPAPACLSRDFDTDGDVDMDDFAVFQRCFHGSGGGADPSCSE